MVAQSSSWVGLKLSGGRYEVTRALGEGGMALVYHAYDRNLDAEVVIKTPRVALLEEPEFADRFRREIRSLVQLAHPHIVKVTDVGDQDGVPFAILQYLPGGSLEDRIPKGADGKPRPMPVADVVAFVKPLAAALDFVHAKGYVHRDIKPANVLFDEAGNIYLGDFGIAKVASAADKPDRGLTGTGAIVGTVDYMSPEALLAAPVGGAADQYSLAVAVFELLCGRRPFEGNAATAVMIKHTTHPPPALQSFVPAIPAEVCATVRKALAKDPSERFPSCTAFAEALATAAQSATATVPDISVKADTAKRKKAPAPTAEPRPKRATTERMAASTVAKSPPKELDATSVVPGSATITPVPLAKNPKAIAAAAVTVTIGLAALAVWHFKSRPRVETLAAAIDQSTPPRTPPRDEADRQPVPKPIDATPDINPPPKPAPVVPPSAPQVNPPVVDRQPKADEVPPTPRPSVSSPSDPPPKPEVENPALTEQRLRADEAKRREIVSREVKRNGRPLPPCGVRMEPAELIRIAKGKRPKFKPPQNRALAAKALAAFNKRMNAYVWDSFKSFESEMRAKSWSSPLFGPEMRGDLTAMEDFLRQARVQGNPRANLNQFIDQLIEFSIKYGDDKARPIAVAEADKDDDPPEATSPPPNLADKAVQKKIADLKDKAERKRTAAEANRKRSEFGAARKLEEEAKKLEAEYEALEDELARNKSDR